MKPDRKKKSARPPASAPNVSGPSTSGRGPVSETEPTAGFAHAPIWLIILFGGMFYWGTLYLDDHGGGFHPQVYEAFRSTNQVYAANPIDESQMAIARGRELYNQLCVACHDTSGLGKPGVAPPLVGSEWVLEPNPSRLIRIPILGLTGPIEVKGQTYSNINMVGLGSAFETDNDLAAVLSYIRQEWGHAAPPVTPEQVSAVKAEIGTRAQQWTADELMKVPVPQQ